MRTLISIWNNLQGREIKPPCPVFVFAGERQQPNSILLPIDWTIDLSRYRFFYPYLHRLFLGTILYSASSSSPLVYLVIILQVYAGVATLSCRDSTPTDQKRPAAPGKMMAANSNRCYCANYYVSLCICIACTYSHIQGLPTNSSSPTHQGSINCQNMVPKFGERCKLCLVGLYPITHPSPIHKLTNLPTPSPRP